MSEMSADCPNNFPCPSVWCRLVTCHASRVTRPAHDIPGVVYSGQSVTKWFVFVECKNLLTATRHVSSSSRTRGGGGGSGIKIISQDLHTERVWTTYTSSSIFHFGRMTVNNKCQTNKFKVAQYRFGKSFNLQFKDVIGLQPRQETCIPTYT